MAMLISEWIIATWLDELHDLRRKVLRRKTTNIIMSSTTPEELREADIKFKKKINAARGTTLRTDRHDMSTEEPPD